MFSDDACLDGGVFQPKNGPDPDPWVWSSAGVVSSLEPGGLWLASADDSEWPEDLDLADIEDVWEEPWGDRRQELVIIGANLTPDLLARLDQCCLSDAEIAMGPETWASFEDPFPAWRIARSGEAVDAVSDDEPPKDVPVAG